MSMKVKTKYVWYAAIAISGFCVYFTAALVRYVMEIGTV